MVIRHDLLQSEVQKLLRVQGALQLNLAHRRRFCTRMKNMEVIIISASPCSSSSSSSNIQSRKFGLGSCFCLRRGVTSRYGRLPIGVNNGDGIFGTSAHLNSQKSVLLKRAASTFRSYDDNYKYICDAYPEAHMGTHAHTKREKIWLHLYVC
jgi:hypothetical protein